MKNEFIYISQLKQILDDNISTNLDYIDIKKAFYIVIHSKENRVIFITELKEEALEFCQTINLECGNHYSVLSFNRDLISDLLDILYNFDDRSYFAKHIDHLNDERW